MEVIMNEAGRLVFIISIILNIILLFGILFFAYQYIKLRKCILPKQQVVEDKE